MQPVGDAKFDINESARDKTSESRDECSCKKPCVCSTKKGPATEIPNECDVKDRRKRSSNQMSDCPCPGPCDCVKCSASICRDDKKRKIGAVDEKESSSFGSFKPQTVSFRTMLMPTIRAIHYLYTSALLLCYTLFIALIRKTLFSSVFSLSLRY